MMSSGAGIIWLEQYIVNYCLLKLFDITKPLVNQQKMFSKVSQK